MKKLIIASALALSSVGCSTNQTKTIDSQSPMVGMWVGASGLYLDTWKINHNGTGVFCYSGYGRDVYGKLFFDGNEIISQGDEKVKITAVNKDTIDAIVDHYGTIELKFYKVNNLRMSSTFCQNIFNKSGWL